MFGRFVPPTPNCGHVEGVTFAWYAIGQLWLCTACDSSIGRLGSITCKRCRQRPQGLTTLVDVPRVGRLCFSCRRECARAST